MQNALLGQSDTSINYAHVKSSQSEECISLSVLSLLECQKTNSFTTMSIKKPSSVFCQNVYQGIFVTITFLIAFFEHLI